MPTRPASPARPYVLISAAMSLDGRIDDAGPHRLKLSSEADWADVDELRASADAIVVGANTIRRDNPRLLVRSPRLRADRVAAGRAENPLRVTLTAAGDLDPGARIFTPPVPGIAGLDPGGAVLVGCASGAVAATRARLQDRAEVVDAGDQPSAARLLGILAERDLRTVLVEGGATVLREILTTGLADELRLAVAPFFVGEPDAPVFAPPGAYPHGPGDPATLAGVKSLGGVAVLHYLLGPGGPDARYLRTAIELSRRCPPSDTAFAVGAIIVAADGQIIATGFSREQEDQDHAEEVALRKAGDDPRLATATLYSSLVPCGDRASRPVTCVQHIIAAGIPRVVFAWQEPPLFTEGRGAEQLRAAGVAVLELAEYADRAAGVNARVLNR